MNIGLCTAQQRTTNHKMLEEPRGDSYTPHGMCLMMVMMMMIILCHMKHILLHHVHTESMTVLEDTAYLKCYEKKL